MPPKKSFASRFASSDEEESEDVSRIQAPKKAPAKKTKEPAGRKATAKAAKFPLDEDDDAEEEGEGEEEPPAAAPKPAIARRGGGRPRGSRGGAAAAARTSRAKPVPTTAKAKDKPTAKKTRTSSRATNVSVEVEEGKEGEDGNEEKADDSDTHLPDAPADEEDDAANDDEDDMIAVEEVKEAPAPGAAAAAAAAKTTSKKAAPGGRRAKAAQQVEHSEPSDTEPRKRERDWKAAYEDMAIKYEKLLSLRITEPEVALAESHKNAKQKDTASEKVIAALTAELDAALEISGKTRQLQKEKERATSLLQEKEKQIVTQKTAFERLQRDNEHLQAKLSSGGRNQGPSGKSAQPSSTFRDLSNLKEELYGDLSGLIIRRVKDDDEGLIVYDCLQTGRNGTLHFKLSVSSAALSNRSDGYNSADSEITYTPLLDPHDTLIENILPDYLKEEITFPREKASSFYLRLATALQNAKINP